MEARAVARYIRIAPRKVRIVLNLIRGKDVKEALAILKYTPKAASKIVGTLVTSAKANAENNHNMDGDNLYVATTFADGGPTMKRIRPRAQGRAFKIRKRTSHITVALMEKKEG